ncbi:gamma-glutamyl-gamma-aminobutyrate hydrolase family protein [Subtercola sp. PAMC28395]|uniref:gamma-glutamyl-gamma-aminobutyrate hydrolase family protein n=1 Tax=Subtercola sp. PAMC28395 TaxID=2846775 RepID=UPI001C0D5A92|nr:gamma-glutamyl-gamma-aminobutyrate hydrolase family protein [Subtercola sp. PAMC28395]QWT23600.1 gamma-glutamyl-gamma-aminobutyrate hydrolase family protein [Subtercola sp. PAMC28395]
MPDTTATKTLAVVEVTRFRPDRPEYHAYVNTLNSAVVAEGERLGYSVLRVGAADVGTEKLLELTRNADALVVMGGEDIDPRFYGASSGYRGEGRHCEIADEAQIALVRRALETQTPLLGICRGLQIINVALGGTLLQDLGEQTSHTNVGVPVESTMTRHEVDLSEASRLAGHLGATRVGVQSAHHQAADRIGDGLVVVGIAADGTPEALEHRSAPIYGVQWHPEAPGAPIGQLSLVLSALASSVVVPVAA